MRERRVGRLALPARVVAGVVGVLALAATASPVHAQDEESGGGTVLCNLHDVESPAGITSAGDDGWWIVSSANGQDSTLSVDRVGEDCTARRDDEAWIEHQPLDPQALFFDSQGGQYLWVGDIGGATDRDWVTLNQLDLGDFGNSAFWRYVFPGSSKEVESFILLPGEGKHPLFFTSESGKSTLFSTSVANQEYDTPLEEVGTAELSEGGSVTGAALNADATKIALRTENAVYEWTVEGGDVVAAITGTAPTVTPITAEGTAQDVAYDAEGNFHVLSATGGDDGTYGTITSYAPGVPAPADDAPASDEETQAAEKAGPSLLDRILGLGFDTIIKILAGIAILGMFTMVMGIVVIRKHRKAHAAAVADEESDELGFAAEEPAFGRDDEPFMPRDDDPIDLGIESGQPDPDLGQVARGNVYGGARQEPTGNVYGAQPERTGNVYGGARQESAGNVYGARPAEPVGGGVYGGPRRDMAPPPPQGGVYGAAREEPQYGAFEGGGHGSVYDNGSGQFFTVRPEPTGGANNHGSRPEPTGNVYGARPAGGGVYGGGSGQGFADRPANAGRPPESDEGYWGPPGNGPRGNGPRNNGSTYGANGGGSTYGGSTYGRGR